MRSLIRHARFLLAFALGLAILAATQVTALDWAMRVLMAVNGFFVSYLALMLWMTVVTSAEDLRRHSEQDDEGITLILILALGTVIVALTSIFMVLNVPVDSAVETVFALAAAPLGWATLHVLAAYRYAHLYYSPDPDGGLNFPATSDPGTWDFLYFGFTIGMTAQVSDVEVTSTQMRRTVLLHSIGAFFYNTVILALAVNAGLALSQ
jgi:uncharacterized membrane protein